MSLLCFSFPGTILLYFYVSLPVCVSISLSVCALSACFSDLFVSLFCLFFCGLSLFRLTPYYIAVFCICLLVSLSQCHCIIFSRYSYIRLLEDPRPCIFTSPSIFFTLSFLSQHPHISSLLCLSPASLSQHTHVFSHLPHPSHLFQHPVPASSPVFSLSRSAFRD